jgi:flavin reductase (DIM6/NTAB) family NADH-FMN oxidoreductase RutF
MKEIAYNEYAGEALATLSKGAFLTTAHGGKHNTMTIGWGSIGSIWGKPILTVMVRPSRFTYGLIEASGEFTVSIPRKDLGKALGICGSKSGRDLAKPEGAGLELTSVPAIATPVIAGCGLHFACKVIYKQPLDLAGFTPAERTKWYADGDEHTVYYAEIIATYLDD